MASDDELSLRVRMALAEADQILRRNGSASYIETLMIVATKRAYEGHGCGYFGFVEKDLEEIEKEATKAGLGKEVVESVIRGYENIIDACYRNGGEKYLEFADKCKGRLKQWTKYKGKKKE